MKSLSGEDIERKCKKKKSGASDNFRQYRIQVFQSILYKKEDKWNDLIVLGYFKQSPSHRSIMEEKKNSDDLNRISIKINYTYVHIVSYTVHQEKIHLL